MVKNSIIIVSFILIFTNVLGQSCYNRIYKQNPHLNAGAFNDRTYQNEDKLRLYGNANYYTYQGDTSYLYMGEINVDSGICENVFAFSNFNGDDEYIVDYHEMNGLKYVLSGYKDTSLQHPFNWRSIMFVFDLQNNLIQSTNLDQDTLFRYRRFTVYDDQLFVFGTRGILNNSVNDARVIKLDENLNLISASDILPTYTMSIVDLYVDEGKIIALAYTSVTPGVSNFMCLSLNVDLSINWSHNFDYHQPFLNGRKDILKYKDDYVFMVNKQLTQANQSTSGIMLTELLVLDSLGQLKKSMELMFTDSLDQHYTRAHSITMLNNGDILCVGDYGESPINSTPTEEGGFLCAVDLEDDTVKWSRAFDFVDDDCYIFGFDKHKVDVLPNNQILLTSRNGYRQNGQCFPRHPWFIKTDSCGYYDNSNLVVEFDLANTAENKLSFSNNSIDFCYIIADMGNGDSVIINHAVDSFTYEYPELGKYAVAFYGFAGCNFETYALKDSIIIDQLNGVINNTSSSETCNIDLQPNPSSSLSTTISNLNLQHHAIQKVEVYNTFGKLVKQASIKNSASSLDNEFPAGLYFVILYLDDGSLCERKLLIQN